MISQQKNKKGLYRTRHILNLNMLRLQLLHERLLERVGRDAGRVRRVRHCCVDRRERPRLEGGEERFLRSVGAEKVAAASAQGDSAGEHQARCDVMLVGGEDGRGGEGEEKRSVGARRDKSLCWVARGWPFCPRGEGGKLLF